MNSTGKYDFRQFQEELAALDRQVAGREPEPKPAPKTEPAAKPAPKPRGRPRKIDPLEGAREAFDALRQRYSLTVADVVAWFPPEEGIAYLQGLLASQAKPRRRRKAVDTPAETGEAEG